MTQSPTIHLVDSGAGGKGKSLFTLAMAHYCEVKGYYVQLIDVDRTTYNVKRHYPDAIAAVLSEIEYQALDAVWQSVEQAKSVLVNLPGGAHELVANWLERDALLEMPLEDGQLVRFIKWFLCDPTAQSLTLLKQSLATYAGNPNRMLHVIVRNEFLGTDLQWQNQAQMLETDAELQAAIGAGMLLEMRFPKFPPYERNKFYQSGWSFAMALKSPKELEVVMPNSAIGFERLEQQRIVTFLKKTSQELERLGLWSATLTVNEAKAKGLLKTNKLSGHSSNKGLEKTSEKVAQVKPSN
ncbi:MAG: hypothetical protein NW224_12845 [Leptolyngbyaceae cyanobacterium bins.302]|nr:hypothetical protein [Leptolyngbyaceae cyanobacterium bins.302]